MLYDLSPPPVFLSLCFKQYRLPDCAVGLWARQREKTRDSWYSGVGLVTLKGIISAVVDIHVELQIIQRHGQRGRRHGAPRAREGGPGLWER
jgi:hypothetical protein